MDVEEKKVQAWKKIDDAIEAGILYAADVMENSAYIYYEPTGKEWEHGSHYEKKDGVWESVSDTHGDLLGAIEREEAYVLNALGLKDDFSIVYELSVMDEAVGDEWEGYRQDFSTKEEAIQAADALKKEVEKIAIKAKRYFSIRVFETEVVGGERKDGEQVYAIKLNEE